MPTPTDTPYGGETISPVDSTKTAGESEAQSDNQETGEKDTKEAEETPVKDEAKMVRHRRTGILLAVIALFLLYVYILLLKIFLDLTVSPMFLFSSFSGYVLVFRLFSFSPLSGLWRTNISPPIAATASGFPVFSFFSKIDADFTPMICFNVSRII